MKSSSLVAKHTLFGLSGENTVHLCIMMWTWHWPFRGVPQGSILRPLLFLISVNDLFKAPNSLMEIMFADDTQLFLCTKKALIRFLLAWIWNFFQRGLSQTNCLWMLIKLNGCYFILSQRASYFNRPCVTFLLKILMSKGNILQNFWAYSSMKICPGNNTSIK